MCGGCGWSQFWVFMPSRSDPKAMTRSASSQSRPAGSTCGGMPTQHGCSGGITPRAPNVVRTGAVRRSASATTSSARSRDPAPAQIRIRPAASISAYASSAAPASGGSGGGPGSGPSASADSRSVGTSRYTGPCRGSVTNAAAWRSSSAAPTTAPATVSGSKSCGWPVISCSTPR